MQRERRYNIGGDRGKPGNVYVRRIFVMKKELVPGEVGELGRSSWIVLYQSRRNGSKPDVLFKMRAAHSRG